MQAAKQARDVFSLHHLRRFRATSKHTADLGAEIALVTCFLAALDHALRAYLSRHSRTQRPLKYTHDLAMEGNHGHHRAPRVCVSSHIVFFVDEMQAKVEKESPFKLVFSAACPLRRCTILIKRTDFLRAQTTRDIQRYDVARTRAVCDR